MWPNLTDSRREFVSHPVVFVCLFVLNHRNEGSQLNSRKLQIFSFIALLPKFRTDCFAYKTNEWQPVLHLNSSYKLPRGSIYVFRIFYAKFFFRNMKNKFTQSKRMTTKLESLKTFLCDQKQQHRHRTSWLKTRWLKTIHCRSHWRDLTETV